jgi:prophage regulatory protein
MEQKEHGRRTNDRLVRRKELVKIVGYSASSIWRRCKDGSFPAAVRLGPGSAVAWRLSEVEAWMNSRQTAK